MKGHALFQGEIIMNIENIMTKSKKIFNSRRGDNNEIAKIHGLTKLKKKVFSRTTGPNFTKHSTKVFWMNGIKFVLMKGHALFQEEINSK